MEAKQSKKQAVLGATNPLGKHVVQDGTPGSSNSVAVPEMEPSIDDIHLSKGIRGLQGMETL